ncbi:hypothetical protein VKT23_017722 [Stygiomarasmius scandens]|uniref:Uncharacterized protein n=1 Tax=Marasmiellus scandens TaxID=2682957 RepID=A0ABR1IU34_9AGAR
MPEPKSVWSLQIADNAKRLRTLLLITISNFILPVIFVIVSLSMFNITGDMTFAGITVSATSVEVIGVLFATIWASQGADNWNQGEVVSNDLDFPTLPMSSVNADRPGGGEP